MVNWVLLLKKLPQDKKQLQPYLTGKYQEFNGFLAREYPQLPESLRRELERNLATRKGTGFLDMLQTQSQPAVRGWAVELACFLPAELRIPRLFRALGDKDEEIKLRATEALGQLTSAEVARELVEGLVSGKWLPARIAQVLSNMGEFSLPYVAKLALSPDEKHRLYAVEILEQINTPRAGMEILRLLNDPSGVVRKRSAAALLSFSGIDSGKALVEALRQEQNPDFKVYLVKVLGRMRYGPAREVLKAQLGSGDPRIIKAASTALEQVE